jgi:hypothetical protein
MAGRLEAASVTNMRGTVDLGKVKSSQLGLAISEVLDYKVFGGKKARNLDGCKWQRVNWGYVRVHFITSLFSASYRN